MTLSALIACLTAVFLGAIGMGAILAYIEAPEPLWYLSSGDAVRSSVLN